MPHPRAKAKKLPEVPLISGLCCIQTDDAVETARVPSEPASARPESEVQITPRMPLSSPPVLLDELLAFELRLQSSIALTMQQQYEKLSGEVLDVLRCSQQQTPSRAANVTHTPVVFAQRGQDSTRNLIQMDGKENADEATDGVSPLLEKSKGTLSAQLGNSEKACVQTFSHVHSADGPDGEKTMATAETMATADFKAYGACLTPNAEEHAKSPTSRRAARFKSCSTKDRVLEELVEAEKIRSKYQTREKTVRANMKAKYQSGKGGPPKNTTDPLMQISLGERILDNPFFDSICALAIVLNAILIGFSVQWLTTHTEETPLLILLGYLCSLFFFLELMLRLNVYHLSYFKNEDWAWNCFDFALVVFSVMDFLIWVIFGNTSAGSVGSTLKIVKMLRIIRVVRVFRFFRELALLALLVMDSLRSLLWTIVMLMILIYIFAIAFTQSASEFLKNLDESDMSPNDIKILDYFGSLPKTIFSLVYAMLGGVSWGEISDPLLHMDAFSAMLFFFYICFTLLAVLNIITGVFVDNAVETAKIEREFLYQREFELREKLLAEMQNLFAAMDQDSNEAVTSEELHDYLDDELVQKYFHALGLDATDAERLFKLIDTDNSGEVQMHEFLDGCLRLKGEARSIDVAHIMWQCKKIEERLDKLGATSSEILLLEQVGVDTTQHPGNKVLRPSAKRGDGQAVTPLFCAAETRQA